MQYRILFVKTVAVSARAFTSDHIRLMDRGQWDITVACADDGHMQEWADSMGGVSFRHVPLVREPALLRDLHSLLKLLRVIKAVAPDIVVFGTPKASLVTAVASSLRRVPVRVYIVHGLRYETASGVRRVAFKFAERVTHALSTTSVSVSKSVSSKIYEDLSANSTVIGEGSIAGVDTAYFSLPSEPAASTGDLRIVFVGRICLDKGADLIVAICEEMEKRGIQYKLDMVGPDELGRDELQVRARLAALDSVRMHGRVEDVRRFLWAADVLLLPTAREGLGLVLLEAAACGVPSVASAVTGCVDVLHKSGMGALVPVGAGPSKWVDEILRVVESSRTRESKEAIRDEVIARFEKDKVCSDWINFFASNVMRRNSAL